ncbi:hypothetical protein E9993_01695 [Labilibacter sediminis]|nr:hypothetical protein E9993_01695 [Labilibacter sediminis]
MTKEEKIKTVLESLFVNDFTEEINNNNNKKIETMRTLNELERIKLSRKMICTHLKQRVKKRTENFNKKNQDSL